MNLWATLKVRCPYRWWCKLRWFRKLDFIGFEIENGNHELSPRWHVQCLKYWWLLVSEKWMNDLTLMKGFLKTFSTHIKVFYHIWDEFCDPLKLFKFNLFDLLHWIAKKWTFECLAELINEISTFLMKNIQVFFYYCCNPFAFNSFI